MDTLFSPSSSNNRNTSIMDSPRRALSELTFKYDTKPIINPNPEQVGKSEGEKILEKIPELLHIMLYGKSKERIHVAFGLRNISEQKGYRRALAMANNFIESLCAILVIEQDSDAHHRCQQHALAILTNLLLEDPMLDAFIANEENCLPGIAKMLLSEDKQTQELVAKALDYISVTFVNQTLVCGTDQMLYGIVQILHNSSKSVKTKQHVLQALVYLSAHPKNRFIIARERGLFDELICVLDTNLKLDERRVLGKLAIQVVYNLCLLKENVPLIAKNTNLRRIISLRYSTIKEYIQSIRNEVLEPYSGYQNDLLVFKLSGCILDLISAYDNRFDSRSILEQTGFNSDSIQFGNHVCKSITTMLEKFTSNNENNTIVNQSLNDSDDNKATTVDERRRKAAAKRNKLINNKEESNLLDR